MALLKYTSIKVSINIVKNGVKVAPKMKLGSHKME